MIFMCFSIIIITIILKEFYNITIQVFKIITKSIYTKTICLRIIFILPSLLSMSKMFSLLKRIFKIITFQINFRKILQFTNRNKFPDNLRSFIKTICCCIKYNIIWRDTFQPWSNENIDRTFCSISCIVNSFPCTESVSIINIVINKSVNNIPKVTFPATV